MSDIKLRNYQQRTVDLILEQLQKGTKKQLINSPTGSGKTVIASELVRILVEQGKKVFFVVANEPLVMQTYNKFTQIGLRPSIIKSKMEKYYNPLLPVQIVMMQSYSARVDKLPDLNPSIIIVDEIDHGYKGQMIKKLFEKHSEAQIVGLTGTPCTFDGYLLPDFDFYHEVITVRKLQRLGFLSMDRNYVPLTPDLSGVRIKSTGDFNEEDLDEVCNKNYIINDIVNTYKKIDIGNKGICFAISIEHGEKLRDAFLDAGIKCGLVHSKLKKFQNDYWLDSFKSGRIQILVNIGKLTRGFDSVDIFDVIMCRPTLSLALYCQSVGRGARPDTLGKNEFRVIDYAGNINTFGLWSEPRLYSIDSKPKAEYEHKIIVCPNCFSVIYERTGNKCPECDFLIKAQQEKREREIKETERVEQVVEIKALTGSAGAIESLTKLLGYNANTFYYTKVLPVRVASVDLDVFNSEVIRLANYCRRKSYKPYYVVVKIREKMEVKI